MKHSLKLFSWAVPTLLALACAAPSALAISQAPSPGINGFSDPGGFTLNANSSTSNSQTAATHGVPTISGGTLHLTTSQGVPQNNPDGSSSFDGNEASSVFYNQKQYIGQFYASFVYHYNGTNPDSFGPGDGFTFTIQNDPRGASALGVAGGELGYGDTSSGIMNSAAVEFNLFDAFGRALGTGLGQNGQTGQNTPGLYRASAPVNLISGDPISVILSYDGTTLSETLFDTVTRATYHTSYVTNLPSVVGSSFASVGFTGGTGAAVADQTITNFIFTNNVPITPLNPGPKLTVTAAVAPFLVGSLARQINVTTTNTGGAAADRLQLTSVTLDGAAPAPAPISPSPVPTTPNLLSNQPGRNTQTNGFVFTPSPGTTRATLNVVGTYTDPNTHITSTFRATIRLNLPPPVVLT